MTVDQTARAQARNQWNRTACGELPGDKNTLEYFKDVERNRYAVQSWMHAYFDFASFTGRRVLEIGVGQGTDLAQFAQAGAECHGIDITPNHLQLTRANFEARGLEVELRESDAAAIAYPDDSFDCVYSFGVLHHIPEIERCIAEVRRVLKPGGTFYLGLYHRWSAFHLLRMVLFHGVLCGGLLRLGYQGVLARIEAGADGAQRKPYVTTYSKSGVQRLLRRFDVDDVSVHQLYATHFGIPKVLAGVAAPLLRPLRGLCGWYVVSTSRKPLADVVPGA